MEQMNIYEITPDQLVSATDQHDKQPQQLLRFSKANSKLGKLTTYEVVRDYLQGRQIMSLSLPAGHSCPFAHDCKSKAIKTPEGMRIKDGKHTEFRCYAAMGEVRLEATHNKRMDNFDALKQCRSVKQYYDLIMTSLPPELGICRVHDSGDYFNLSYMRAWLMVARDNPGRLFYFYTKALPHLVKLLPLINQQPNFVYTASYGGTHDHLIAEHKLRYAKVVYSVQEADNLGLEIDNDDIHALLPAYQRDNFALLIHGSQPAGTPAAAAYELIRRGK